MDNDSRYSERGSAPLFYIDDITLSSTNKEDGTITQYNPVYFRVQDLLSEYANRNPDAAASPVDEIMAKVRVRELNETFRGMIRPGGKDESVKNLLFVPIPESV